MRKKIFFIITFLLFFLSACKPANYELILEDTELDLYVGETYNLVYLTKFNNKEKNLDIRITATSDKVKIDGNKITALVEGTSTLTINLVDEASIYDTINIRILNPLIITNTENILKQGESLQLIVDDLRTQKKLENLSYSSSDEEVANVDSNGLISALGIGNSLISVENEEGLKAQLRIYITQADISSIGISFEDETKSYLNVYEEVKLIVIPTPSQSDARVYWSSSNEEIASISSTGFIKAWDIGQVTITATSMENNTVQATISIEVKLDPIVLFENFNVENVLNKLVSTYGASTREQQVYGSISNYFFDELIITEDIAPITMTGGTGKANTYVGQVATPSLLSEVEAMKFTRSGILQTEIKYITYHDTGNNSPGANATMHSAYLKGAANLGDRARSWHYTVDSNSIVHHIPNNEVTWQGDSYTSYSSSIGIETAVDFGSDLYATWHRTAKLIAYLMLEYGIPFENIKQHNYWNGKECPQTLRRNNLYDLAMDMVRAEVLVAKYLSDYEISFTPLNADLVDNHGRVIKLPDEATRVAYLVNIKNETYNKSTILYSNIPGIDGSIFDIGDVSQIDLNEVANFDKDVANIDITKDDENTIRALKLRYSLFTEAQQRLVASYDLLEEYELILHSRNAVDTAIVISQFLSSDNDILSHGYIQLYNHSDEDISLEDYSIQISDGSQIQIYTFPKTSIIKSKSYFLLALAETNKPNVTLLTLPDAIANLNLGLNGYVVLATSSSQVINPTSTNVMDFVGFGNSSLFEGSKAALALTNNKAVQRWGLYDTNNNEDDFLLINPQALNSKNEVLQFDLSSDEIVAREMDFLILSLPSILSLEDEALLNNTVNSFNNLSANIKALVRSLDYLDLKQGEFEELLDPNYKEINKVLQNVPKQIVNDFNLPSGAGIVWSYKDGEDESYFDIEQGIYLKLSFEAKYITLIATYQSAAKEVVINFGILKNNQQAIFYTGEKAPSAGGTTGAGKGTSNEQSSALGFEGVAIVVGDKVYFVAEKSYIELDAPTSGNTLSMQDLRPYGSNADATAVYNQSLIKGVPSAYKGAGTLYENVSGMDLVFNPSITYGRNNAGSYGYAKLVFSPNADGTYTVKSAWPDTGTNTDPGTSSQTLLAGELLWCPHTLETNANYGTWLMKPGPSTNGTPVLEIGTILNFIEFKTNFN